MHEITTFKRGDQVQIGSLPLVPEQWRNKYGTVIAVSDCGLGCVVRCQGYRLFFRPRELKKITNRIETLSEDPFINLQNQAESKAQRFLDELDDFSHDPDDLMYIIEELAEDLKLIAEEVKREWQKNVPIL